MRGCSWDEPGRGCLCVCVKRCVDRSGPRPQPTAPAPAKPTVRSAASFAAHAAAPSSLTAPAKSTVPVLFPLHPTSCCVILLLPAPCCGSFLTVGPGPSCSPPSAGSGPGWCTAPVACVAGVVSFYLLWALGFVSPAVAGAVAVLGILAWRSRACCWAGRYCCHRPALTVPPLPAGTLTS